MGRKLRAARDKGIPGWVAILGCLLCLLSVLAVEGQDAQAPGRIVGRVGFEGKRPQTRPIPVPSLREICGETVPDESALMDADGGLQNAVVYLDGVKGGAGTVSDGELRLDNRACRFEPHVLLCQKGQEVRITNSDPLLHNIHGYLGERTVFNIALPKGSEATQRMRRPGFHLLLCDAGHSWMRGTIAVFDHPYFAKSAPDGSFELPKVPPGTYKLRAWHERFGEMEQAIEVAPGRKAEAAFTYKADGGR